MTPDTPHPGLRLGFGEWGDGWREALSIHKCSNAPGHTEMRSEALATFMPQD